MELSRIKIFIADAQYIESYFQVNLKGLCDPSTSDLLEGGDGIDFETITDIFDEKVARYYQGLCF